MLVEPMFLGYDPQRSSFRSVCALLCVGRVSTMNAIFWATKHV